MNRSRIAHPSLQYFQSSVRPTLLRRGITWLVFATVATGLAAAETDVRVRESFDFGWRFHHGDVAGADQPAFDDSSWQSLDLPHDWSIEGPYDAEAPTGGSGGYLPAGIGWYRKTFQLPSDAAAKKVVIQFDGIYQNSTVWMNGHELGFWPYGYTAFHYDLTPHLKFGSEPNVIAVRVDSSQQPSSRWYAGAGIYRHTWLTTTDPLRVAQWGTFVTTPEVSEAAATVRVRTRVENGRDATQTIQISNRLFDAAGSSVGWVNETSEIAAGDEREFTQSVTVSAPKLWSVETPDLYTVRTEVRVGDTLVDDYVTPFGIRSIEYHVDRGFLLNGRQVKMRGVCLHHDGGAVGAAVPEAVWERRLRIMKEMGANAVRASHNPMAPEFYDLCDRLGLLVMDEVFDEWTVRKPQIQFGYSDHFDEWHERDVVNFVRRNRNHPSIVMWSAGNEIGEQWAERGPEVVGRLVEIFHREDPTRPVTAAMDNVFNNRGNAPEAFTEKLDIVGYNYADRWLDRRETYYGPDRSKYPDRKFVGTESSNVDGVRGVYRFGPPMGGRSWNAADNAGDLPEIALWASEMIRAENIWRFVAVHDYVIGDFMWTGIDYLGESRWPRKLAAAGTVDTCGFKKDAFYFYQSQWTDEPMVHVFPHWNIDVEPGRVIPVIAYSNCDVVELFVNGKSYGAKAREFPRQGTFDGWNSYAQPVIRATTADLHFSWDVPYSAGEVRAVGYKDGRQVVEQVLRTTGAPVALHLAVDRSEIAADARDVAHVRVSAVDAAGTEVPMADHVVQFEVAGSGELLAVDNGDPTDHSSYQADSRRLFNGLALALVRSTHEPATVRLTARAEGLQAATLEIRTTATTD